jgi:hypothetical protein
MLSYYSPVLKQLAISPAKNKSFLHLEAGFRSKYGLWLLCQASGGKDNLTIKVNTIVELPRYNLKESDKVTESQRMN